MSLFEDRGAVLGVEDVSCRMEAMQEGESKMALLRLIKRRASLKETVKSRDAHKE